MLARRRGDSGEGAGVHFYLRGLHKVRPRVRMISAISAISAIPQRDLLHQKFQLCLFTKLDAFVDSLLPRCGYTLYGMPLPNCGRTRTAAKAAEEYLSRWNLPDRMPSTNMVERNYPNRFPNASKLHSIAVWSPHTTFDFDSITPHHDEISQSAP